MSVQAVSYILEGHPSKGADRMVLLSLANHADGRDWECWPSVDLIAWEANLTTDHVRRALRAMDQRGWITRVVNAAPDDRIPADRRPNLYRIVAGIPSRVRAEVPPVRQSRVGDPRGDGWDNDAATGRRGSPTKPSREPSEEPSRKHVSADDVIGAGFDRFWTAYPRKTAKGAARKAWPAAVKRAGGIDRIVDGATRYAAEHTPPHRFTAYPASWLNADRWDDEPIAKPPEPGGFRPDAGIITDRDGPSGRIDL